MNFLSNWYVIEVQSSSVNFTKLSEMFPIIVILQIFQEKVFVNFGDWIWIESTKQRSNQIEH